MAPRIVAVSVCAWIALGISAFAADPARDPLAWPPESRETRPWAYWWWMGSAVDPSNLTREIGRYRDAGLGGVHIIPIYGAKGYESRYIEYLSPKWMEMMRHSVEEAGRANMGVDMTTGSGWCFGGPQIGEREACAVAQVRTFDVAAGGSLDSSLDRGALQALIAFSADGKTVDLLRDPSWKPAGGQWRVFAVSQRPCSQKVKRAAPGGEGHMLNPFAPFSIEKFLEPFTEAFAKYNGPKPRAMYHDSFEYQVNWSPVLLREFERRRGYRLEDHLDALFGKADGGDRAARVKSDYRETGSDLMIETMLPPWVKWSHERGFLTRNEAHGSPGNLLDLYAAADIPETEMFRDDRDPLVSMFASSAAHVAGRKLVSSETGTWMREHFTETLADMKETVELLWLSGVNHIIYHGTCYSPDDAPWPGWVFYASTQMNPRNPIWRDAGALNAYISRSQSVLQYGQPDNDVLLYWPIYDLWHDASGLNMNLTVHRRAWLSEQPVGKLAKTLWERGFTFDYVSDRQARAAGVKRGAMTVPGGTYKAVVSPASAHMPLETLDALLRLARSGATVIFEGALPGDVPGWGDLENRRAALRKMLDAVKLSPAPGGRFQEARVGAGRVIAGDVEAALAAARLDRETIGDTEGLRFVRRSFPGGRHYFIVNRGAQAVDGWVRLNAPLKSAVLMDPMTGRAGVAATRQGREVYLQLGPHQSVVVRALDRGATGARWTYWKPAGAPAAVTGTWRVKFVSGGPDLPPAYETAELQSWTARGGPAESFGGTALYSIEFDAPESKAEAWRLDLGKVIQSARVRLNGRDLGAAILPPFQVHVDRLQAKGNLLEVEVTNVGANRIRDLDRRNVAWRYFRDINFVNIDYKPFDASGWPVRDSGLLGPVTLTPVGTLRPN